MAANVNNLELFFGGCISLLSPGMITNLWKGKFPASMSSKCCVSTQMMSKGRDKLIKLQASRAIYYFNAIIIFNVLILK